MRNFVPKSHKNTVLCGHARLRGKLNTSSSTNKISDTKLNISINTKPMVIKLGKVIKGLYELKGL